MRWVLAPVSVEVKVTLEPRHVERALWITTRRHTPGLRVLPVTVLLAMLVPVGLAAVRVMGHELPSLAYLFAFAGGAFGLGVPLAFRYVARQSAALRSGALQFSFDETGFVVRGERGEQRNTWPSLYEVIQSGSLFMFYEKPSVFHIVPVSGASERAEIESLVAQHAKRQRQAIDLLSWLSPGFIALVLIAATLLLMR